jgi:SAM-dependent methyltransferase
MNYEEIFRLRGGAYDHAMQLAPEARREEFLLPIEWAGLRAGETVVDVPAGGGYLRRYLPAGVAWRGHEPCSSFNEGDDGRDVPLLPLPWPDGSADAALSIAGVHHLEDKRQLFAEVRRVLRPTGRFVLADAHEGSAVSRFLDEFVGLHNSTGHSGIYLGAHTRGDLEAAEFEVVRAERVAYAWWFHSRADLGRFARLLFDVRYVDDGDVAEAVERILGTVERNGEIGMRWELYFLRAQPSRGRVA